MGGGLRLGASPLTAFACPACRAPLDELACAVCGAEYEVEDGMPVFLAPRDPSGGRADQARWFDEADPEYEVERPLGTPAFHGALLAEKFRRGVAGLREVLPGATALAVCGGSGMDAEFLARAGGRVISADASLGAARRARERGRRHGVELVSIVADAEALPFPDRSIDIVYVHDGLHHVERPRVALAEMARVARLAVSVNEPARAAMTAVAVRLGLALEREPAGNPVRRLELGEVTDLLRAHGFTIVRGERYAMLYRHRPGAASRLLSRPRMRRPAERALRALDPVGARIGNKLTVQAIRRDA